MLASEEHPMKMHTNQGLWTMPYPLERLAGARSRGYTMAPEGQKPSQWLCLTELPSTMYSQPTVHKALSRGTIRQSACILAEITIRKSQSLSLQRHLIKYLVKALFSVREVGAVMALLHVSHQLQDLIRIKDFERQHDFQ